MNRALLLRVLAVPALSIPLFAQSPGFGPKPRTLGIPTGASKLLVADLTAEGLQDAVQLHADGLTLLHNPYLHGDVDGNAISTKLVDRGETVHDIALMTDANAAHAAGVVAVVDDNLELMTWDAEVGVVRSILADTWPDPRLVASWTVDGAILTVVSTVEGNGDLRTISLMHGTGDVFSVSAVVPLGSVAVTDIELLDWDGDGAPEIAIQHGSVLDVCELDGTGCATFPMNADGKMEVLKLAQSTPGQKDRIVRLDRDAQVPLWYLDVLGQDAVEAPFVLPGTATAIAVGYHDEDDLPDVLVGFASGSITLYPHQQPVVQASFDPLNAYGVFDGAQIEPVTPISAASLADMDGDGDGEAWAADSALQGWIAFGTPVDATIWHVGVGPNPSVIPIENEDGDELARVQLTVTLPSGMPSGPTHVEVVTWEGSSQTFLDPSTRRAFTTSLEMVGEGVNVDLPVPGGGMEDLYVAEIRLVAETTPRHAYPAVLGDLVIENSGNGFKGPSLRGAFICIPPGSPPPFQNP